MRPTLPAAQCYAFTKTVYARSVLLEISMGRCRTHALAVHKRTAVQHQHRPLSCQSLPVLAAVLLAAGALLRAHTAAALVGPHCCAASAAVPRCSRALCARWDQGCVWINRVNKAAQPSSSAPVIGPAFAVAVPVFRKVSTQCQQQSRSAVLRCQQIEAS
eukprot:5735-Heterococcus_DN1.PRE.2